MLSLKRLVHGMAVCLPMNVWHSTNLTELPSENNFPKSKKIILR